METGVGHDVVILHVNTLTITLHRFLRLMYKNIWSTMQNVCLLGISGYELYKRHKLKVQSEMSHQLNNVLSNVIQANTI